MTALVIAVLLLLVIVLALYAVHLDEVADDERASHAALRRELSRHRHPSQDDDESW